MYVYFHHSSFLSKSDPITSDIRNIFFHHSSFLSKSDPITSDIRNIFLLITHLMIIFQWENIESSPVFMKMGVVFSKAYDRTGSP